MVTASWRGRINQLTYGLALRTPVDDATVTRLADELVQQRLVSTPVADYHDAVTAALRSGEPLAPPWDGDEQATRDFLDRLLHELDDRRPWPAAPYDQLEPSAWPALATAPVVARVPESFHIVQARIGRPFTDLDDEAGGLVIALRLRTGQVVGLRMSADLREQGAAVHTHDDPRTVVADLRELTGLPAEPLGP
ncbi:MAG: hypothetical protein ACRCY9_22730 [Phycicoccus sp.]